MSASFSSTPGMSGARAVTWSPIIGGDTGTWRRPVVPSKRSEIPRPKMNPDEATARGIVQNEGVLARRASDCILCRAPGHALYARLRDEDRRAPGVWNLLACSACGLVRLDPRPLPDEIGKLYHAYYTHAPSDPWSGVLFTWGIRRG